MQVKNDFNDYAAGKNDCIGISPRILFGNPALQLQTSEDTIQHNAPLLQAREQRAVFAAKDAPPAGARATGSK